MARWGVFIGVVAGMVILGSGSSGWAQDEPIKIAGISKPLSEWLKMLKASEVNSRRAGLVAMGVAGPRKPGVLPALVEMLEKDSDVEIRQEVAQLLGSMGADAKEDKDSRGIISAVSAALASALKSDKADSVRETAARALGGGLASQVEAHVLVLAAALKDPHAGTRTAAAATLRDMGDKARAALPQLIEALKDSKGERFGRTYAAQALGRFKDDVEKTAPALASVLREVEAPVGVRQACATALGQLGAAAAVSDLAKTLEYAKNPKDKSPEANPPELRRDVLLALMKMADKAKAAWPAIQKALDPKEQDPDNGVRLQAIRLAGMLGGEEVVPTLKTVCVEDAVTENRLAAIQELGQLGPLAKDAVDTLTRLADQDSRFSVREAAHAALKRIKGS